MPERLQRMGRGTRIAMLAVAIVLVFWIFGGISGPFDAILGAGGATWSVLTGPVGFFGVWGLLQIGLAVWVGIDAQKRGSLGLLWGLFVLFTNIVGLIVYLLVVHGGFLSVVSVEAPAAPGVPPPPPAPDATCPACSGAIHAEFKHCPHCGHAIERTCASCGAGLQAGWKNCPYCAAPASDETP
jgi:hypothetical protein